MNTWMDIYIYMSIEALKRTVTVLGCLAVFLFIAQAAADI